MGIQYNNINLEIPKIEFIFDDLTTELNSVLTAAILRLVFSILPIILTATFLFLYIKKFRKE